MGSVSSPQVWEASTADSSSLKGAMTAARHGAPAAAAAGRVCVPNISSDQVSEDAFTSTDS